jgi:hypothetical protein
LPVILKQTLPKLADGNRRILVGDNVIPLDDTRPSLSTSSLESSEQENDG